MSTRFDAIVIGAGQAGPALADRLTRAGMTVAFIERKLFGGTRRDQLLSAPRIFINVGGRASIPDMPGVSDVPYLTNSTRYAGRAQSAPTGQDLKRPRASGSSAGKAQ